MKRVLILALFLLSIVSGYSQEVTLKTPNRQKIDSIMKLSNVSIEPIYVYLQQHFEATTEKQNVKTLEYSENVICSFTQEFENGIFYKEENCSEEGGGSLSVSFKSVNRKSLENWIEKILRILDETNDNIWNKERTQYYPKDQGAGCYFEIKSENNETKVEVYCGC